MHRPVSSVSTSVSIRHPLVSKRAFAAALIACTLWPVAALAGEGGGPTSAESGGGGTAGGGGSAEIEYAVGCQSDTDCGAQQICTGSRAEPGACVAVADSAPHPTPDHATPDADEGSEAPQCAVTTPGSSPSNGPGSTLPVAGLHFAGALLLAARRRRSARPRD